MTDQLDPTLHRSVTLLLLREAGLLETAHTFERESGLYSDMDYLKELLKSGNFDEADKYLSGFAKPGENLNSSLMFYHIRKIAFVDALERKDPDKAREILKGLKFLLPRDENRYRELAELLSLDDIREHCKFTTYPKNTAIIRGALVRVVENQIKQNPVFYGKLTLPCIPSQWLSNIRDLSSYNTHSLSLSLPTPTSNSYSSKSHHKPLPSRYNVPRILALMLSIDSTPTSMKFHPREPFLLLVGTSIGDVELWDLSQRTAVWDTNKPRSKEKFTRVKCVAWSPDGSLFGVAYSVDLVHIYSCSYRESDIKRKWEFEVHNINDFAFWYPHRKRLAITCGGDKKIQVWDMDSGEHKLTLEGHGSPIYSLCPHPKNNNPFFFSTSVDGKVNGWYYGDTKPKWSFKDSAGRLRMEYSADGQRLFACGSRGRVSTLVELDGANGSQVRTYQGLDKPQDLVAQFGVIGDFLAVGHDRVIKYWDMNHSKLLGVIEAEGGLPVNPQICFNKGGTLLAVDSDKNMIKILATRDFAR